MELVSFEIHVAYFERANLARSKTRVRGECNRMTSASGASGSSLPTFGSSGSARRKECKGAVSGEVTKACETGVRGPAAAPGRVPSVTRSVRPPRRISFGAAVVQAPRGRVGAEPARAARLPGLPQSAASPCAVDRLERTPSARGLVRAADRPYSCERVADVKRPSLTNAGHLLLLRSARGGARSCSARVTSW